MCAGLESSLLTGVPQKTERSKLMSLVSLRSSICVESHAPVIDNKMKQVLGTGFHFLYKSNVAFSPP